MSDHGTTPFRLGYGTNGFTGHDLDTALRIIADLGYQGVGLTLSRRHLDPYAPALPTLTARLSRLLDRLGLSVVIETGDPYLLDRGRAHSPGLMHDHGRGGRIGLLKRAVRIGAEVGARVVHLCSGHVPHGVPSELAWDRLASGCAEVLEVAEAHGITLALEPEPDMFVNVLDRFEELRARLGNHPLLGLTLDIGHAHCLEPRPVLECVRRALPYLAHVQIEDMRRGVHQHLEFGQGEIDFPPVLRALAEGGHRGLVSVEIQDGADCAPDVARRSLAFLRDAVRLQEA
ncbi:sugar phosphate isomerase/epimerase family protein [Streptomyces sp. NPDC004457]